MKSLCSGKLSIRLIISSVFFLAAISMAGCDSYAIQGKVVQGPISDMHFISIGNTQLDKSGLEGARITVYRDPDRLSTTVVGRAVSDSQGRFTIKLDAFGAGWMLEQWKIVVQQPGFKNAIWQQSLTTDNKQQQLLVTMAPGYSESLSRDELWKQYEQLHQPKNSITNK